MKTFGWELEIFFIISFEPININSVLATLRLSLLAINHFLRFSKSEFTAASRSVIEFAEAVRFVSSANNRGFVLFRQWGKLLMYNKKNNGPKIEPCGTPHLIKRWDEKEFFMSRNLAHVKKNHSSYLKIRVCNQDGRRLWGGKWIDKEKRISLEFGNDWKLGHLLDGLQRTKGISGAWFRWGQASTV